MTEEVPKDDIHGASNKEKPQHYKEPEPYQGAEFSSSYPPYRTKNRGRKKITVWRATAAATIALTGVAGKAIDNDPLFLPRVAAERILHNQAPEVPDSQVQQIVHMLNQPQNPELAALDKESIHMKPEDFTGYSPWEKRLHSFYSQEASKYNLHLIDVPAYDERIDKASGLDEILDIVNEAARQYRFGVNLPEHVGIIDQFMEGAKAIDPKKVSLKQVRWDAQAIINGLQLIPIELGRHLNLKEINLYKSIQPLIADGGGTIGADQSRWENKINMGSEDGNVNAVEHELGHQFDDATVRPFGMGNDPSFTRYNPKKFKYGNGSSPTLGYPGAAIVEDYGKSNVMEDKATYYNFIFSGGNDRGEKLGRHDTVVREKMAVLLARLDKLAPGYAKFFANVSYR